MATLTDDNAAVGNSGKYMVRLFRRHYTLDARPTWKDIVTVLP